MHQVTQICSNWRNVGTKLHVQDKKLVSILLRAGTDLADYVDGVLAAADRAMHRLVNKDGKQGR